MIQNIDIDSLDTKKLILLNSKLPWPSQKIIGGIDVLPFTIRLGIRIHLDNKYHTSDLQSHLIEVDSKKIIWGLDSTDDFLQSNQIDFHKVIGDGWLYPRNQFHVNSLFHPTFWMTEFQQKNNVDISSRKSWCLTMSRKDHHRDLICDILAKKYLDCFTNDQWFCYDGIDKNHDLIRFMFRQPNRSHKSRTQYSRDDRKNFTINKIAFNSFFDGIVECALGPWHNHSLIELVPEGTVNYFEPTEKLIKPISAGMPFVMVASYKFLYRLRKIGFKTFSPWIDESYDEEGDWQTRTEMAVDAMFKFLNSPKNLDQIQMICDHNRQILQKIRKHDWQMRIVKKLRPYIHR